MYGHGMEVSRLQHGFLQSPGFYLVRAGWGSGYQIPHWQSKTLLATDEIQTNGICGEKRQYFLVSSGKVQKTEGHSYIEGGSIEF